MTQKKTPEEKVRQMLQQAGPHAVRYLIRAMQDEALDAKQRVDVARDLLNRGFGKQSAADSAPPALRVVLSEEVEPLAE